MWDNADFALLATLPALQRLPMHSQPMDLTILLMRQFQARARRWPPFLMVACKLQDTPMTLVTLNSSTSLTVSIAAVRAHCMIRHSLLPGQPIASRQAASNTIILTLEFRSS